MHGIIRRVTKARHCFLFEVCLHVPVNAKCLQPMRKPTAVAVKSCCC
jgi:hypothetical protein